MKIAVISDVHANIYGLKTSFSNLPRVDKILCAGDITGYYPFVNEVIDELKANGVIVVKGNHDQYLIDGKAPADKKEVIKKSVEQTKKIISKENLDWIKSLPEALNLNLDNKRVLVVHGSPWNHLEQRIYPDFTNFEEFKTVDSDIVILGHTHYPMIKKIGSKFVINPGSCGQPRDYNLLSYILWDTENNEFVNKRIGWNIREFEEEARKRGTDEKLFEVFKRKRE